MYGASHSFSMCLNSSINPLKTHCLFPSFTRPNCTVSPRPSKEIRHRSLPLFTKNISSASQAERTETKPPKGVGVGGSPRCLPLHGSSPHPNAQHCVALPGRSQLLTRFQFFWTTVSEARSRFLFYSEISLLILRLSIFMLLQICTVFLKINSFYNNK